MHVCTYVRLRVCAYSCLSCGCTAKIYTEATETKKKLFKSMTINDKVYKIR